MTTKYIQGSDLPDLSIVWTDANNTPIDFSMGYTFELKIGFPGEVALITKTSGITGAVGSLTTPNVVISWATTGELNALPAGVYTAQLKATRTIDTKTRYLTFTFEVGQAVL